MGFVTYCSHHSTEGMLRCMAYRWGCSFEVIKPVWEKHVTSATPKTDNWREITAFVKEMNSMGYTSVRNDCVSQAEAAQPV